jgi:hypothetical protein
MIVRNKYKALCLTFVLINVMFLFLVHSRWSIVNSFKTSEMLSYKNKPGHGPWTIDRRLKLTSSCS